MERLGFAGGFWGAPDQASKAFTFCIVQMNVADQEVAEVKLDLHFQFRSDAHLDGNDHVGVVVSSQKES